MTKRLMGVATVLCASLSCGDDATRPDSRVAATVLVRPDSQRIRVNYNLQMYAVLLDSTGDTLVDRAVTWTSSDTSLVSIAPWGLATGRAPGPVTITATADSVSGSTGLRVLIPVARVSIDPFTVTLVPGGTLKMTATLEGSEGSTLSDRDVTWVYPASAVAIAPNGMIKGLQVGRDSITATSEGIASWNHAIAIVTQPAFVRIESEQGALHTCAIAADGRPFCWGANQWGALGTGTFGDSLGQGQLSGTGGGIAYPTGVLGTPYTVSIATGSGMSCALNGSVGSLSGYPYCWGSGAEFQLGSGNTGDRPRPGPVLEAVDASAVVAGAEWGCALGLDSVPYCWGGSMTGFLFTAGPVSSRKYVAIAGAYAQLCGIAIDSLAYCGFPRAPNQTLVSDSLKFTRLGLGYSHSCGITADSTAYCWGGNDFGQLGDGTRTRRDTPAPVNGSLKFVDIAGGFETTCGIVAPSASVYCWGYKRYGILGADTTGFASEPQNITGTLGFVDVTLGAGHACGISVAGRAYCWGDNQYGQLGDGTTTKRFTPTLVAGQQP